MSRDPDDLVKIGITAPPGSNCRLWTFSILPTRQDVIALGNLVGTFFKQFKRLVGNALWILGWVEVSGWFVISLITVCTLPVYSK